jgi:hypothetical protein
MLFSAHGYAQIALGCARKYREFKSAKIEPVERRATVAEGEARLALLEQHLDEIVKLHTSLHAAERDPMAPLADVMELDEQLNAAIEAARSATVKS